MINEETKKPLSKVNQDYLTFHYNFGWTKNHKLSNIYLWCQWTIIFPHYSRDYFNIFSDFHHKLFLPENKNHHYYLWKTPLCLINYTLFCCYYFTTITNGNNNNKISEKKILEKNLSWKFFFFTMLKKNVYDFFFHFVSQ